MNARKRQGEPLLPTCSPKQPRRTLVDEDGNAPSASQGNLTSRWFKICKDVSVLVFDTFFPMAPGRPTRISPGSDTSDDVASTPPSPRKLPQRLQRTNAVSPSPQSTTPPPNALEAALDKTSIRPEDIPLPPSPKKFTFGEASSPPRPKDAHEVSLPKDGPSKLNKKRSSGSSSSGILSGTTVTSSAKTSPNATALNNMTPTFKAMSLDGPGRDDLASVGSSSLLSDTTVASGRQTPRRASQSSRTVRRKPRSREHIYYQVHKSQVREEKKAMKEQIKEKLRKDIYKANKELGYRSSEQEHDGFLVYSAILANLFKEKGVEPFIPATAEDVPTHFLESVLHKAKETLNSPKPAKVFAPSLDQLKLSQRLKDDDIERRLRPPVKPLPPSLPDADEKLVNSVLSNRGFTSKFAREQVSHSDITRLLPRQWLNDEIINFYGAMLLGRSEAAAGKKTNLWNIHYFNSFFWTKLTKEGYDKGRLAKWTKKIDIFSKDAILLPVNHNNTHWTAAAINFRNKRFESYDSMGMAKERVFMALREYVNLEHQNKKKKPFDFTGWTNWAPDSTPQQENGYDCGVFTCQFMESLSRGQEMFNFSQKDMPYLRRRMIWEIGKAKLRDDH